MLSLNWIFFFFEFPISGNCHQQPLKNFVPCNCIISASSTHHAGQKRNFLHCSTSRERSMPFFSYAILRSEPLFRCRVQTTDCSLFPQWPTCLLWGSALFTWNRDVRPHAQLSAVSNPIQGYSLAFFLNSFDITEPCFSVLFWDGENWW